MEFHDGSSVRSRLPRFSLGLLALSLLGTVALAWISPAGAGATQGAWEGLGQLSEGSQYGRALLATEPNGDTLIAWESSPTRQILGRTRSADGTLGPQKVLLDEQVLDPALDDLVIGPDGTAALVLRMHQVSIRPPGGEFGPPETISQTETEMGDSHVAIGSDGSMVATWVRGYTEWIYPGHSAGYPNLIKSVVRAAVRPPDGVFGSPETISVDDGKIQGQPQITIDSDDLVTVAWSRSDEGMETAIETATRPADGAFGAPTAISDPAEPGFNPQVVTSPDDTATVLWQGADHASGEIFASTRPDGGTFGTPETISDGDGGKDLRAATGQNGTVAATWIDPESPEGTVWVVDRASGGSFGSPTAVTDLSSVSKPMVGISANGTVTSIFSLGENRSKQVYAATRPAGGSFEEAHAISGEEPTIGGEELLVNQDGSAIVTYRLDTGGENTAVRMLDRPAGGTFGVPIHLSQTDEAGSPEIAMGPDGFTVAAWGDYQAGGTSSVIQASVRRQGWDLFPNRAKTLSPPGDLTKPVVASGLTGHAAVAWQEYAGSQDSIQVSVMRPGSGNFSDPIRIAAPGFDYVNPQIGIDSDGEITLVWVARHDDSEWTLMSSTMPVGGVFSPPAPVSDPTTAGIENPQLAVAQNGAAVVTWRFSNPGGADEIHAAVRKPGRSFARPTRISTPGQHSVSPEVAIAPSGSATVAWVVLFNASDPMLRAASTDLSGKFTTPVDVAEIDYIPELPSVSVGPDGSATLVWMSETPDGPPVSVWTATRSGGPAFSTPEKLSSPGKVAVEPKVSIGTDGTTTALWDQQDLGVTASTRDPGGSFGPPVSLSDNENASYAQIAVGLDGEAVSVWRSQGEIAGAWAPGTPVTPRCTAPTLRFRSFTKNERSGRGSLAIRTDRAGKVTLAGSRQVSVARIRVRESGKGRLTVKAKGAAARKLGRKGRVTVRFKVTFRPSDGCRSVTKSKRITLAKRNPDRR